MGLDTVELLWTVEKEFDIEITDAEAVRLKTVGALNQLIAEKVAAKASTAGRVVKPEPTMTWDRLVPIIIEELGVPRAKITPEAEWGRDLGAS